MLARFLALNAERAAGEARTGVASPRLRDLDAAWIPQTSPTLVSLSRTEGCSDSSLPAFLQSLDSGGTELSMGIAHGREPGEYLAKLGRVYMGASGRPWAKRLGDLLSRLEEKHDPTIVLLESRSGLHDIAAATVTDLDARVLLFATDSESTWTDYGILFHHWQRHGLAPKIRERLSFVSALTPELDTERYLQTFRHKAWGLFREHLYDDGAASANPDGEFSFDPDDERAPHAPLVVHWTRGLAAGTSLRLLERSTVEQAYAWFLKRFDRLMKVSGDGEA